MLRVRSGVATLAVPHLFEAKLTLVPAPDEDAVLARCGASSGVAPSPAPSGVTVQPKASQLSHSVRHGDEAHVQNERACRAHAVSCAVLDHPHFTVQAPADGAQPAGQAAAAAVEAEAGAEPRSEPATGGPAPQQAADAPASMELGPGAAVGAASEPSQQPPEQQRHERWRWRLLSFTILPGGFPSPRLGHSSTPARA